MNPLLYNIILTIIFLGAIQGFFLGIILLRKRINHQSNIFISVLVSLFSADLLFRFFLHSGYLAKYPETKLLFAPLSLLYGPMIYFYIKSFFRTKDEIKFFSEIYIFNLIPFILIFFISILLFINFILLQSVYISRKLLVPFQVVIGFAGIFSGFYFTYKSLKELKFYRKSIEDYFSNTDEIRLLWLRNILFISIGIWILSFLFSIINEAGVRYNFNTMIIVYAILAVFIYYTGYKCMINPVIYFENFSRFNSWEQNKLTQTKNQTNEINSNFEIHSKYEKNKLDNITLDYYSEKLNTYMNENKPYRNPELNLTNLAKAISIPEHHLSQTINIRFNKNFYNYLNSYRRDDVMKRILSDRNNSNLLELAFDSGFNSKATFNRVFKQYTGMTPSDYKNSIKN